MTLPTNQRVSYQLQYRTCGKCSTCRNGGKHGPYTYAFWREGGRLRSAYIGTGDLRADMRSEHRDR
jgi:hypothetical protein